MTQTAKRSISMAAALAASLLMSGAAFAQGAGANGSTDATTNATAATSNSTTKGSAPATGGSPGAAVPSGTAATAATSNSTTMGSKPAAGGSQGAMAPKGEGANAMIGDSKSPGSVQPGDPMAKPKMTAKERADRKAANKAKRSKNMAPKEEMGMSKP